MKEKINFRFLFIGLLSILLTAVSFTLVFYSAFQEQAKEDLQNSAGIIAKNDDFLTDPNRLAIYGSDQMRITLISPDGQIQYESRADESRMDNHLSRPEIQSALQNGSGEAMRQSSTLGYDTYYYALRLQNGSILRVSMEIRNMYSIFEKALPMVIVIGFLTLLISIVLSSLLTKQLIKPIEAMAQHMDTMEENTPYKELIPFVRTIKEQQKKKMETAKMRQEFTANVSHELKTPLAVIQNYGTMLQQPGLTEEKRLEYARSVTDSARRLASLVTNILKLNKLENQQIFPAVSVYNLSEQLCESLLQFEPVWEKQGIEIDVNLAEGVRISADAELLSLVWNNLLSNAFKFTRQGGTVGVILTADSQYATVQISDTGCGMSPEVGAHIFEKFYQGDASHATQGNGLGLALVKRVVDIMGGEICVESAPGVGSTFTVKIRRNCHEGLEQDL